MKNFKILLVPGVFLSLWNCGDQNANDSSALKTSNEYSECSQILSQGFYDDYSKTSKEGLVQAYANWFCSMDSNTFYTNLQSYLNDEATIQDGSSTNVNTDFSYAQIIGVNADGSKNVTNSEIKKLSKEEILTRFTSWKSQSCGQTNTMTDRELAYTISTRNPNSSVVRAWQACVTKRADPGLSCWATLDQNSASNVVVQIKYNSGDYLPRDMNINVSQDPAALRPLTNPMPSRIGVGQGLSLLYQVINKDQGGTITINGSTTNPVNYSTCSVSIPGKKPEVKFDDTKKFTTGIDQIGLSLPKGIRFDRTIDPSTGDELYQTENSIYGLNEDSEPVWLTPEFFTFKCNLNNLSKTMTHSNNSKGASYYYSVKSFKTLTSVKFVFPVKNHCFGMDFYENLDAVHFDYYQNSEIRSKILSIINSVKI